MSDNHLQNMSAAQLVVQLESVYNTYSNACRAQEQPKGMSRMFRGWFNSGDATITEPINQNFLRDAEETMKQLAAALERLDNESERNSYAAKAMELIMAPKPRRKKTTADWYLSIAEYHCEVILPHLSREDLTRIRDNYMKTTPRKMMYPKEKELCQKMDAILESVTK